MIKSVLNYLNKKSLRGGVSIRVKKVCKHFRKFAGGNGFQYVFQNFGRVLLFYNDDYIVRILGTHYILL